MIKKITQFVFLPPIMVSFLTLAPFSIYFSDLLSERAQFLSRQVGFDLAAFVYALACVLAFGVTYFPLEATK